MRLILRSPCCASKLNDTNTGISGIYVDALKPRVHKASEKPYEEV